MSFGNYIKYNQKIKQWVISFFTLVLIITCSLPVHVFAAQIDKQTLKAGFFAWDGYHVQDENGLCSGYGYDFLKMTESYCNWKIDFVGYDKTWSDMMDMLDNGEIDVLTSAQKTAEWEAKYEFTDQPIGNSATVLSVRQEEEQYIVGNPKTYDGMKVGCLEGSSRNEKFAKFAEENNFTFQFVTYNSLSELKKALADKQVDGILSTNLRTFNGETVLEIFDPTDYYAIAKKGNIKVIDQLNQAIDKMNFNTPSWKEQLQDKYFTSNSKDEMVFTAEELKFLNQLKNDGTIYTVVTNPDLNPYSSYDENGNPMGIAPQIFSEIADQAGIKYQFQSFDTYQEYNNFVREGKADIDLTCFHDFGLAAKHGILISNAYMTTSLSIVKKDSGNRNIKKIAEVEGSGANTTYSEAIFDQCETIIYQSNKDIINAVKSGNADAAYQYTYMAQKSVEEDVKNSLTYSVLPQYQIDLCMGINENLDYCLITILNEGIRALSGTYTERVIHEQVTNMSDNTGMEKFLHDYPVVANTLVLISVLFILMGVFLLRKKRQTEQKYIAETEANNARVEFFLMISHELRTPLNAVVSYLRMMKEEYAIEEGAKKYLEKAQLAAMQITEISDNMRDYSHISYGTMELRNGIIKIKEVILQVNQIIAYRAKEKKQNYTLEISNLSRQFLEGDCLRVELIFQNILENAVKFTPEGGTITAQLREECIDQENVRLVFTCHDNGMGMSEEFTKEINTAFHQKDPSYSRTHGGLGLGLFLTQHFIKSMNGTFEVESKEREGSTFTIMIPLKSPKIEELQENGIKCKPIRVIVYDTKDDNLNKEKEILKLMGCKVDAVDDVTKLEKKIRSRCGGPYEYAICLFNVDLIPDSYLKLVHKIAKKYPAIEMLAITEDESIEEIVKKQAEIAHVISGNQCYFELFNAIVTDFGDHEETAVYDTNDYSKIHALIVEDNSVNAEILSKILNKKGISSTICENGQIALDTFEAAEDNTYQIIFMDIQMPVMDGIEAAKCIRNSSNQQGATIPIVAVSANAFPEDVEKSIQAGMNQHLAKPVDLKRVYDEINKYCCDSINMKE